MTPFRRSLFVTLALAVGYALAMLIKRTDHRRVVDVGSRGVTIVRERVIDLRSRIAGDEGAIAYDEIHVVSEQVQLSGDDHEDQASPAAPLEDEQIEDEEGPKEP